MSSITFFGGAGSVTGSKHLVEIVGKRILLDCGTFQGLPDVHERNRAFPFEPDSLDAVIVSHAHLDHSGMLPLLVKRGYTGPIYCTPATADVMRYMLEDAAGIEMQDAEYKASHHIGAPDDRVALFTHEDVAATLKQVVEVPYVRQSHGWYELAPDVRLKLYDAGHILGSSVIVLEYIEGGQLRHVAYTGDLGALHMPLLHNPEVPEEEIDILLMESTYGNRIHSSFEEARERLAEAIRTVCSRNGIIVVPSFSLGRTQMLVYIIHQLVDAGAIPRFPIFVDSPLATDITDVYKKHSGAYDTETQEDFAQQGHAPLAFRNLTYIQSSEESRALNGKKGPFMIISASGMMTAGRVVHHLKHTISNSDNAIFITGYQAVGTTGRQILSGVKNIELHSEWFPVHAEVFLFNEFSAHADQAQLIDYAAKIAGLKKIALVHGEEHEQIALMDTLKNSLSSVEVLRPHEGTVISI